jgi:hypothetical protein
VRLQNVGPLERGGVAGLVPEASGPRRTSNLTPQMVARIRRLARRVRSRAEIAAACGVSESSVRNAPRPARPPSSGVGEDMSPGAGEPAGQQSAGEPAGQVPASAGGQGGVPVLPDPLPRDAERVLARWGLLGEGAAPVFAPGAPLYPLAGLLLALPALEATWRN